MRATTIFDEKRELLVQLTELDRQRRDLQHLDADAVARIHYPFRGRPCRKRGQQRSFGMPAKLSRRADHLGALAPYVQCLAVPLLKTTQYGKQSGRLDGLDEIVVKSCF